ncbi:MAG: hypothetical protein ACLUD0_21495 [Eubacterium ramulus]
MEALRAEGNKVRVWVSGDEEFTETTNLSVWNGKARCHCDEITKHALKKPDNVLAEGVLTV